MAIEKSSASPELKGIAGADAKSSKAKAGAPDAIEPGAVGGFMAIFSALDQSTPVSSISTDDHAAPLGSQLGSQDVQGAQIAQDNAASFLAAQDASSADAAAQDASQASALLFGQVLPWAPMQTGPTRELEPNELTALQNTTGVIQPESLPPARGVLPAVLHAAVPVPHANEAESQTTVKSTASSIAGKEKLSFSALSQANSSSASAGALMVPSASNEALDARMSFINAKAESMPNASAATIAAAASLMNAFPRDEERRERSVLKPDVTHGLVLASPTSLGSPATGTAQAAAPAPVDVYVAEQVKYWISNDVKNAEMKLDGLGGEVVEVSIRMQGNEAHVAFRTDELQARTALENATSHLKDMLQREGLHLSGVSVGSSGTQDAGAQARRERQGMRQLASMAVAVDATPAPGASSVRHVSSSGRALDLFV